MRAIQLLTITGLLLTLGFCAAGAQACTFAMSRNVSPLDQSERQKLAKQILEEMTRVDTAIPNLSPKEQKWLDSEMAEESSPMRKLRAVQSNENQLRMAKEWLAVLRSLAEQIADAKYKDRRQEMMMWTQIVGVLLDMRVYAVPDLQRKSVATIPDLPSGAESGWVPSCTLAAQKIVVLIILPYLQNDHEHNR